MGGARGGALQTCWKVPESRGVFFSPCPPSVFISPSVTLYLNIRGRVGRLGRGQPSWALGLCAPTLAAGQTAWPSGPPAPPRWSCRPSHQPPVSSPQIQERVPRSCLLESCGSPTPARRMPGTISASPRTARAAPWGEHGWWCKVGLGKGAEADPSEPGAPASLYPSLSQRGLYSRRNKGKSIFSHFVPEVRLWTVTWAALPPGTLHETVVWPSLLHLGFPVTKAISVPLPSCVCWDHTVTASPDSNSPPIVQTVGNGL